MDIGGGGGGGGIISSPGTDDVFARRRSRRVSFADTTAVHVFDRDEDFETPPEEREPGSTSPTSSGRRSSVGGENEDDMEEDFHPPPVIFLQGVESSSPGSAAGSIASTDDGNFFGPVSTSFIQTGRPSDSGMSEDDNHDITMDSRTFSLHFRNIAPPDENTANSAASLMTPSTASEGPLKKLTEFDPAITSSNGQETLSGMSLLRGSPRTYGYSKVSPTLSSILQKIKEGQQTYSPIMGTAGANEESKEGSVCIDNGNSPDKLGMVNTIVEHIALRNPVSTSRDLIQEDNEIIIDSHDNSQNCNHDHMDGDPCVNSTAEPPAMISPAYKSFKSNSDLQSHLIDQSLSKHQLSGSNCTASVSSMCNVDLETHLLDQPPGTDNTDAFQLSSAATAISLIETEQLRQKNEVMHTETVLHTPRTVGLQLQVSQGSVSSLRAKRQKLFTATPLSNNKVARQEGSLGTVFIEHGKKISDLKLHECNSFLDSDGVGRKRTVEETDHAVQECSEEITKTARSPKKSREGLPCVSEPSPVIGEKQDGAHDNGKSVNIDWNKVVFTITNATDQVLSASISKNNLQQLDMLRDRLDSIHMARKYKRLSTAVRISDWCGDKQRRLEEAIYLHDKLFYEKAKLQINNMKLANLQKKAQVCQAGIQECRFLKSKILGAAQMKDASLPTSTLVSARDRQEEPAIITEKRLELNNIQEKVEKLRSSLECLRNIKGDIGSDNFVRCVEEQLMMKNQHRIILQQAVLCKLNDIVKRDSRRHVILNYHNLLFQRIILDISDTSIFVNNSLNGNQIEQVFPNLDASLAFKFVFNVEEDHIVRDLRSLQNTTMETSLLLGNLIDVLEEIKLSQIKLLNLTSVAFVLESQTCLGLHLSFISFKSGKKIAFIIDMTHLNRSVYRFEPSDIPIKVCEAQTTLAQTNIAETMASIRNLQPGRRVIPRLCLMVSRLINGMPR